MAYFRSPKILFGSGILRKIGSELEGMGKKAVLIAGKRSAKLSDQLVEVLAKAGFEVNVWDGAEPEPSIEVAKNGSEVLAEFNPQLVIGFGGGSAIDTAKAAWIFWERPDLVSKEIEKIINPKNKLNLRQKAKFMAVPTTSGTGSEVNWAIVLTDSENHRKIGVANNEIVPDIALLVPELTAGMPPSLTASTGLDVLGHAFDAYTARQQNDFSDGLCLQAMKIAFEWLPVAYKDGNNIGAREKMQNAAAIAGLGFGNSNTSLCHALAHAIGASFGIPHGRAVGIILPYSLEYISSNPPLANTPDPTDKLSHAAKYLGIKLGSAREAVQWLVKEIRQLGMGIGQPLTLKQAGIDKEELKKRMDSLVSLARSDVNMFSCPCECKEENIKEIFLNMYSE